MSDFWGTFDKKWVRRDWPLLERKTSWSWTMYIKSVLSRLSPPELKVRLKQLVDLGIIEQIGRGRGTRYILCHRFYEETGRSAEYTRKRGLDKETNKQLLLTISANAKIGAKFAELTQVLPTLSLNQVKQLVKELKAQGKICSMGNTKASLWYPVAEG